MSFPEPGKLCQEGVGKRTEMGYTGPICQKPWKGLADSLLLKAGTVFTNKHVHSCIHLPGKNKEETELRLLKHQIPLEGPSSGFISEENRR